MSAQVILVHFDQVLVKKGNWKDVTILGEYFLLADEGRIQFNSNLF